MRRAVRKAARTAAAPSPTSPISITVAATPADQNVLTLVIMMTSTDAANAIAGGSRAASSRQRAPPGSAGGDDPAGDPADHLVQAQAYAHPPDQTEDHQHPEAGHRRPAR